MSCSQVSTEQSSLDIYHTVSFFLAFSRMRSASLSKMADDNSSSGPFPLTIDVTPWTSSFAKTPDPSALFWVTSCGGGSLMLTTLIVDPDELLHAFWSLVSFSPRPYNTGELANLGTEPCDARLRFPEPSPLRSDNPVSSSPMSERRRLASRLSCSHVCRGKFFFCGRTGGPYDAPCELSVPGKLGKGLFS